MDLLEQPDVKETYDKCKYIVKLWEYKFKKKYNRLPSKLDIREASAEVRHAYRKYFQLKTAALEKSFMDVEGFEEDENIDEEDKTSQEILNELAQTQTSETTPEKPIIEQDVSIPNEVWGPHLSNKQDETKTESKIDESEKPNPNLSISKKLFCGSKFTKRNPRKSLSFSQKTKSKVNDDKQISMSQPTPTNEAYNFKSEEVISCSETVLSNKFKIATPIIKTSTQPVNIVQSVIENNYKPSLKTVDAGWLERVMKETGNTIHNPDLPLPHSRDILPSFSNKLQDIEDKRFESTKVDYDSEDIIEDSDTEEVPELSSLHIGKKRRIEATVTTESQASNSESVNIEKETINEDCAVLKQPICSEMDSETIVEAESETQSKKVVSEVPKTEKLRRKRSGVKKKPNAKAVEEQISPRRSTRTTKVKASFEELSCDIEEEEEDAFHTDTDEKDPEFTLDSEKTKLKSFFTPSDFQNDDTTTVKTKTKKSKSPSTPKTNKSRKRLKNTTKIQSEDEDEDDKPYELEFSVKPRIVAPRYKSIKKVLAENKIETKSDKKDEQDKDPSAPKDKRERAKENLEKKILSGNLNDNFVRINLKKKVFVRGKSAKNFSKYKKALWKSKKAKALAGPDMDMGGCDGGTLTCFNCGQTGHFARNCTATKGDGLLPLTSNEDEDCPFPTLEEASKMAMENVLSVRIPKITLPGEEKFTETNENQLIASESEHQESECEFDDDLSDQLLAETLKLEEHIKKLDVRSYIDTVKVVKPYYELIDNETPREVYEALERFGYDSFRPGQEQAIMRILSGRSTLVTLSTGSGKSLCYQLPAYMYSKREPCISLVISPLVSLMDDQVVGIPKFMKAACLHSNQTKTQRQKILEAIAQGELSVLLVSPEAVVAGEKQSGFGSLLRKLPPIAFACIDEAHCVSQWSHNFRPSYLMICRVLRESLGVKTILGLTATATRATKDSIIEHLRIPDGLAGVISDTPLPDNLVLSVSRDVVRDRALLDLLMSERFVNCKSVIVYCTRRDECERIAAFLRTSLKSDRVVEDVSKKRKRGNLQAEPYHAGLSASRRRTIQSKFMSGELRIVVATVAFGMGINKADIRAVIHFNMPNSFESYVQEVGRAGRDGLQAQCHVFLDSQGRDENELRRHIHANSIDRYVIRKLLQKIFVPCSCSGKCPKHEVAFSIEETVRALDIPEENIATLLCYLELHENKYIELLSPAYTTCKVISYGGPLQIRKAAKECPPLAMALALHKNKAGGDPNVLQFPVVDVAAAMGWESGICKHKLKNLEWNTINNQPKRSTITVQFSNLGFRLLAVGNLSDDSLDEALDSLYNKVTDQEQKALLQLHAVHKTLIEVAQPSYRSCGTHSGDGLIKSRVREYFNSPEPLRFVSGVEAREFNEDQLVSDIHALICMYKDNTFNGRAVARIFQGIQSPNYPAVIWGRCKFWRKHLDVDFHTIAKIATREIIRMR